MTPQQLFAEFDQRLIQAARKGQLTSVAAVDLFLSKIQTEFGVEVAGGPRLNALIHSHDLSVQYGFGSASDLEELRQEVHAEIACMRPLR